MSADELKKEPLNDPAGDIELGDEELGAVAGGSTECAATLGCCPGFTNVGVASCCCTLNPKVCEFPDETATIAE